MTKASIAAAGDENKPPTIEVLELRPLPPTEEGQPPSSLKAFAKVQVGPWTLFSCRVIQQPGQRAYAQLPMRESGGASYPVLGCSDSQLADRIKAAILTAWASHQQEERDIEQLTFGLGEVQR